jgi:hypothetical protein
MSAPTKAYERSIGIQRTVSPVDDAVPARRPIGSRPCRTMTPGTSRAKLADWFVRADELLALSSSAASGGAD